MVSKSQILREIKKGSENINIIYYSNKFDLYFIEYKLFSACGRNNKGNKHLRVYYYTLGTGKQRKSYHKLIRHTKESFQEFLFQIKSLSNSKFYE